MTSQLASPRIAIVLVAGTGVLATSCADLALDETPATAAAPNPGGPPFELPDLIVNKPRLEASLLFTVESFSANACAVIEGCVSGTGQRDLLRFDTVTPNIGVADLVLGDPDGNPMFEYSTCHNHYHFTGYVSYGLMAADGVTVVVPGRKQAFCLRDSSRYLTSAGPSNNYACENQGLTAGWQDVYPRHLECQWLDVTGVPRGDYFLRLEVNPPWPGGRLLAESRYDNNVAMVPVTIGIPFRTRDEAVPSSDLEDRARR